MKLRIEQKELAEAARRAHRRLPAKPLNPVLAGLLLEATADTATLSGFDLETSTRATLDAETLEPGQVLVSGRLLADVTAALPAGPVDVVADDHEVTVSTPGNAFSLPAMERRDYPALPDPPKQSGTVDGPAFNKAVAHAAEAAMSTDDAVGQLEAFGGVEVAALGDTLRIRSSDRYRLVEHALDWRPENGDGSLLIPAEDLKKTSRALAGGPVHLSFGNGHGVAALTGAGLAVTSRTIASEFPDIGRLFPQPEGASGWAIVDGRELMEAVKRAALVNDKEEKPVVLDFTRERITVRGGTDGSRGISQVDAETVDLDGFQIAFRPGFLSSLLAPMEGPVRLWLYTPTKSVLMHADDDNTTYRAVCMPVRLK
ncbi:DNA polymerase III subunit beta [Streptomyces sp.]|uniref:DNA polymerase III subunit beta n=1 Tax=Streptomyces sp. TaxID=1931 RepID=UPI0028109FC6|nr:DNA polymerase III subunit beta [Streptomyces sp.]